MRVLGLDVSTSCTGFSTVVVDDKGKIVVEKLGHVDTSGEKTLWGKIDLFESEIKRELSGLKIDHVYVEEALLSFRTGASNANTITKLVMFNALVSNMMRKYFELIPVHIPSQTARKKCGIKLQSRKLSGVTVKQQTFEQVVNRIFPEINFSFNVEMTRTGKPKPHMYDSVDGFVVAYAGILNEKK